MFTGDYSIDSLAYRWLMKLKIRRMNVFGNEKKLDDGGLKYEKFYRTPIEHIKTFFPTQQSIFISSRIFGFSLKSFKSL